MWNSRPIQWMFFMHDISHSKISLWTCENSLFRNYTRDYWIVLKCKKLGCKHNTFCSHKFNRAFHLWGLLKISQLLSSFLFLHTVVLYAEWKNWLILIYIMCDQRGILFFTAFCAFFFLCYILYVDAKSHGQRGSNSTDHMDL